MIKYLFIVLLFSVSISFGQEPGLPVGKVYKPNKPEPKVEVVEGLPIGRIFSKEDTVLKDDEKLLFFTASWCGPCKILKVKLPTLSIYKTRFEKNIIYVDVEQSPELQAGYKVNSVPTLIIYKLVDNKGLELRRMTGYQSEEIITEFLRER